VKKLVVIGAIVAGGVLIVRLLTLRLRNVDFGERIAAMPDTAPPKWIFMNITAIRENTERILELLEAQNARFARGASDAS
jgi:hypothetical protein